MPLTQHNGAVYQHKGRNQWKESWLCLESNGKLVWKKKDAYQVKGMAYADEVLNQIQISGWSAKKCSQNDGVTPFLMHLPIEIRGAKSKTTLILKHGDDLELWLDAFATVVGRWKLWKACKHRQAVKIGKQLSIDERNVEHLLKYEQLVEFYRTTWLEFLEAYKRKETGENEISNGHLQNGIKNHYDEAELANGDRNGVIARQLYAPNGLKKSEHTFSTSGYTSPIQLDEKIQVSTAIVHQSANGTVNGTSKVADHHEKVTNGEIYGEEDDGEEVHF